MAHGLVELYATAYRTEVKADQLASEAARDLEVARRNRQAVWRKLKEAVVDGVIPLGAHITSDGTEVVTVEAHRDYPEVFPVR